MAAEADMNLIAAPLQIGQAERAAREGRGHQHHVQVIAGRVAVPESQPGDAARRQAQPADRHLRHLRPCRTVRDHPFRQRKGHMEDILRMARRARHALRVMERRAEAKPGDGAADRLRRAEGAGLVGLGQVAQHGRNGVVEGQVRPQSHPLAVQVPQDPADQRRALGDEAGEIVAGRVSARGGRMRDVVQHEAEQAQLLGQPVGPTCAPGQQAVAQIIRATARAPPPHVGEDRVRFVGRQPNLEAEGAHRSSMASSPVGSKP